MIVLLYFMQLKCTHVSKYFILKLDSCILIHVLYQFSNFACCYKLYFDNKFERVNIK